MKKALELFDLTGRRALVAGGAGLLGQVFSDALADVGAEVFLLDNDESRMEIAHASLSKKYPGKLHARNCNLLDQDDVTQCINHIASEGQIDVLVNSAGIDDNIVRETTNTVEGGAAFPMYPLDAWRRMIDGNLTSTFLVTQATCKVMARQESGSVINISSIYGVVAPDQRVYEEIGRSQRFFKSPAYSTAKAGILGFTRATASYYRETGVRVNTLILGGVNNGQDVDFVDNYSARTIIGRMASADDYRGAVVFLCSDASMYMTGACLVMDGGWAAL